MTTSVAEMVRKQKGRGVSFTFGDSTGNILQENIFKLQLFNPFKYFFF